MKRILVIEDSPTQAIQMQLLLESEGLEVAVAGSLAAAVETLAGFRPDVILLDLILPDASGLDGLDRLLRAEADTPIVVLTAVSDEETAIEAVKQGAQDYLVKGKPDASLLLRTVRYAIERHRIKRELQSTAAELRAKNAELERLNEQKNHFLGIAAHDLRNPLGISLAYSKFLLEKLGDGLSDKQRKFIDTIRTNSEFMLHLINDLLDVSKIEAGKLQLERKPTDLVELIGHNVNLNGVLAEKKRIELRFEAEPALPKIEIDGPKVEQVLNNLISNAIKFSHPDTTVEVDVRRAGANLVIAVRDHGQGIPAEERSRLFQPFEKTSVRSTAGEKSTGLGLAIARKIVTGHGGDIRLESEVGEGSTFFVSLPLDGRR